MKRSLSVRARSPTLPVRTANSPSLTEGVIVTPLRTTVVLVPARLDIGINTVREAVKKKMNHRFITRRLNNPCNASETLVSQGHASLLNVKCGQPGNSQDVLCDEVSP